MQPTSPMSYPVSFRKKLRRGQKKVYDRIMQNGASEKKLNVQQPTGYGKTLTYCGGYALLKSQGLVNRILIVFPNDPQLDQFYTDGPQDLQNVGFNDVEDRMIIDIRFSGIEALKHHRNNTRQVYVITAQSLIQARGMDNVIELMKTGRWMVVVDEYHHYGIDKAWGKAIISLNYCYLMTMSATPYRPEDDSAFGPPDIITTYREAVEEGVVKELIGHSYNYRIDAVGEDKVLRSFTTKELVEEVGSSSPEDIEKFKIERRMRWSPKYISPLIYWPIQRMLRERNSTKQRKLQALVGAICVSHAQLVCEQIQGMYPELKVDWVGTGPNGRPDHVNKQILKDFCPAKDSDGNRTPILDVLVHVGKAGEGLDATHISEVIHLNRASKNNSNDQENGRASRFLMGANGPVKGNINFDTCSEYAINNYVGTNIMDAMDCAAPSLSEEEARESVSREYTWPELPDEPNVLIVDMELESIDSGHPDVVLLKKVLVQSILKEYSEADLLDPNSPVHEIALQEYKRMRALEASKFDEKSVIKQLRQDVDDAVTVVSGRALSMMYKNGVRFEKSLPGDIKYRINTMKKRACGEVTNNEGILRNHYDWLKKLDVHIITKGLPEWLS